MVAERKNTPSSSEFKNSIIKRIKNSTISYNDLILHFSEMTIEYCLSEEFSESINKEDKAEAIKILKFFLVQLGEEISQSE